VDGAAAPLVDAPAAEAQIRYVAIEVVRLDFAE